MEWSAARARRIEEKARDILQRITPVLQDWPPESLRALAHQMAELEIDSELRAGRNMGGPH